MHREEARAPVSVGAGVARGSGQSEKGAGFRRGGQARRNQTGLHLAPGDSEECGGGRNGPGGGVAGLSAVFSKFTRERATGGGLLGCSDGWAGGGLSTAGRRRPLTRADH